MQMRALGLSQIQKHDLAIPPAPPTVRQFQTGGKSFKNPL